MAGLVCTCKKGTRVRFRYRGIWHEGILLEDPRTDQTHVIWIGSDWFYVQPSGWHDDTIKIVTEKGAGAWI